MTEKDTEFLKVWDSLIVEHDENILRWLETSDVKRRYSKRDRAALRKSSQPKIFVWE